VKIESFYLSNIKEVLGHCPYCLKTRKTAENSDDDDDDYNKNNNNNKIMERERDQMTRMNIDAKALLISITRKASHLFFMEDLKLLGRNENDLKNEIKIVQKINKDMNMDFGLEKCARICLKRGRVQSKMHIGSTFEKDIIELDPRKASKYLGIEESFDIQHKNEKEKLKKEYLRRLRLVLGTELNAKNEIQANGSLAVPVLTYSFGIFNWHQEELQKLDRKTRKLLTIHGNHHPKADVDRLYVPRKTVRKWPDAVRSSPCSRNYKNGGICRQEGRPTNTGCQNTPTQLRLSSVTDS
jgi:glutaredoxin